MLTGVASFYINCNYKHITPHHNRKNITAAVFACVRYGGDEGSRTPVRKPVTPAFYERSRYIKSPLARACRQACVRISPLCMTDYGALYLFTVTAK